MFPRSAPGVYNDCMPVRKNWATFQDDLFVAVQRYGRRPEAISVMAVSKSRTVDQIREARRVGLGIFGENRVEEASRKYSRLDAAEYRLYLIGHLQSNKAAGIDRRYAGVHSVDSIRIAGKLSAAREKIDVPLEVLIQLNTSGEESKSGFRSRDEFEDAAAEIAAMPFLELKGVMTMAPLVNDEAVVRRCFSRCREWSQAVGHLVSGEMVLSMGMSSDYAWAVAEGSTLLRIGTAIFGSRE